MKVFVAGATGAIGARLVPQLVADGHEVTAMTRTPDKQPALRALGAEPVLADGLDARSVMEAVGRAEPEVVVHEMTGLRASTSLRNFDRAFALTTACARSAPTTCSPRPGRREPGASSRRASATGTTSAPGPGRRASRPRSTPTRPRTSASRSRPSATSSARSSAPTAG